MAANSDLFISVVVPVYNGSKFLPRCLDALAASSHSAFEIILVDDASTDDSAHIGKQKGVTVVRLPGRSRPSGPAAARNFGAQMARGEVLFFVDADVVVERDSMARVAADFADHPEVAAVFGSYDDTPAEENFVSQYKNLYHHFVHQHSSSEAVTFWAGCGAIRREVFEAIGGFDQNRYAKPSVEDIELGYRMRRMGYRIRLDKGLQAKHLKQWTLRSLLRADIFGRAVPWSRLILESGNVVNDLNLRVSDRVSAALVGVALLLLSLSPLAPRLLLGMLVLLGIVFGLNHEVYAFFWKRKGAGFVVLAVPMQLMYYVYSIATFALCWGQHRFLRKGLAWK